MSDEDILERGGTQEDINRYAHDVGGACGLAYGWTCDYCTTTDNTKELDGILTKLARETTLADRAADIATTADGVKDASKRFQWSIGEAKQALLDWHNKQVKKLIGNREPSEDNIYDTPEGVSLYLSREHRKAIRNEFRGEILSKLKESK